MKKTVLIIMYCFIFCGCINVKTKLTEEELLWLPYQTGDTLIFKSTKNEMDTTYILERKIWYSTHAPLELHGKYNPQLGDIIYFNKNIFNADNKEHLITICKIDPMSDCTKLLSYYNTTFFNDDSIRVLREPLIINNEEYYDVLIFQKRTKIKTTNIEQLRLKPKQFFWSRKEGLVKYYTYTGECWELYYRSHLLPPVTDSTKAGAFH